MTPDEFYARVQHAADAGGRLPLPPMTGWDTFPFEPDGLPQSSVVWARTDGDDVLPAVPAGQRDADAALVGRVLAESCG
jgi:hypothetical protein